MSKRVRAVELDLIDSINASARSCFPHEFLCVLNAEDGIINGFMILPGTVFGDAHSTMIPWMAPHDLGIVGSAHSHPGHSNEPSDADLDFFSNYGGVHIITCLPFDRNSWRAYDPRGRELQLDVVYSI